MRKALNYSLVSLFAIGLLFPFAGIAALGVGVGTGQIDLDKPVKPGGLYTLPSLTVINTGDEPADYGVSVEYKQDQPKMSPAKEWFAFSPAEFHLEPGQSQVVEVKMNIPIKTVPGEYFAYLEGHPIKKSQSAGGATIGIGAAAKLMFTVAPANIFQGIYYRLAALIANNAPWSYVVLAVLVMSLLVTFFRRFFSFNIGIKRKSGSGEA